jgi:AcrR family transcriptional regulator
MANTLSINRVGRPKILDRQHVIEVAFHEYWLHGINNVSISKIATISKTSRPGIYIEFGNEDKLKAEALKKYIKESVYPVYENYENYKNFPNQLMNNYKAIINDGNDNLTSNKNYNEIKRPKKSIGCMLLRSILNINTLGPLALNEVKKINEYRKKQLKIYILNAQNNGVFYKNFDTDFFANFILEQFKLVQLMRLEGSSKKYIKHILKTSLDPFYIKKELLH